MVMRRCRFPGCKKQAWHNSVMCAKHVSADVPPAQAEAEADAIFAAVGREATAKAMRAAIRRIPEAWCRTYRDGACWAGSHRHTATAMREVAAALEAAGFRCECKGEPGTAGQFIIEVSQ